jgi:hypothetical protein
MKKKMVHDKRLFYDRQKEPLDDPEWFKAENTGKKHYFLVAMHNGGKTIKLYTQALADLFTKRTGLHTQLI